MRIVVKKVGKMPEVREIKGDLEDYQEIVGGYIECFIIFGDILCVCNEEGKLRGLPANFIFNNDFIVGDVFFCSIYGDDFDSLNDKQIERLMYMFN